MAHITTNFTLNTSNSYQVKVVQDINDFNTKFTMGGVNVDNQNFPLASSYNFNLNNPPMVTSVGLSHWYILEIIPNPGEVIIAGDFTIDGKAGSPYTQAVTAWHSLHSMSPNIPQIEFNNVAGMAVWAPTPYTAPSNYGGGGYTWFWDWSYPSRTGYPAYHSYFWQTPAVFPNFDKGEVINTSQIKTCILFEVYEDDSGNEWTLYDYLVDNQTSVTPNTYNANGLITSSRTPIKLRLYVHPNMFGNAVLNTAVNGEIHIALDIDEVTSPQPPGTIRYECVHSALIGNYCTPHLMGTHATLAACQAVCTNPCDWVLDKDVTTYPLDAASLVGNTWPTDSMGGSLYSDDSTLTSYVGYDDTLWAVDTQQSYTLVHTTPNLVYPIGQYDCGDAVLSSETTTLSTSNPLEAYIEWTLTPEFVYDDVNFVNQNIIGSNLRILGMFPDNTDPGGNIQTAALHAYGRTVNYYHPDTPGWNAVNYTVLPNINFIRTHEVYDSNSPNPYPVSIVIRVYLDFAFPTSPTSGIVNIDLGRIEVNPPF